MNKRGQFYLIAALAIIGIMMGLTTIYNSAKISSDESSVYSLFDEINYEANQVIDHALINGQDVGVVNLEILTDFYAQSNLLSDFIIVYGDETTLTFLTYENSDLSDLTISLGANIITLTQDPNNPSKSKTQSPHQSDQLTINLDRNSNTFTLNQGYVFFLIIKKDKADEKFLAMPNN